MISARLRLIFSPTVCCRTSFPTLTPHILALTEKCPEGAQRILSLLSSCQGFHAKSWSWSFTAPSISPSPTVHPCNTVHVQLGWNNYEVTILFLDIELSTVLSFSKVQYLTQEAAGLKVWRINSCSFNPCCFILTAVVRLIIITKTKLSKNNLKNKKWGK